MIYDFYLFCAYIFCELDGVFWLSGGAMTFVYLSDVSQIIGFGSIVLW